MTAGFAILLLVDTKGLAEYALTLPTWSSVSIFYLLFLFLTFNHFISFFCFSLLVGWLPGSGEQLTQIGRWQILSGFHIFKTFFYFLAAIVDQLGKLPKLLKYCYKNSKEILLIKIPALSIYKYHISQTQTSQLCRTVGERISGRGV